MGVPVNQIARPKQPLTIVPTVLLVNQIARPKQPLTIVPPVPLREPSVQLELLVRIVPLANGLMLLLVSVPVRTVVPVNQIARPKQPLTIVPTVLLVNLLLVAMLVPPVPLREPSVLLVVPVRIVPLANGLMLLLVSVPVRTV